MTLRCYVLVIVCTIPIALRVAWHNCCNAANTVVAHNDHLLIPSSFLRSRGFTQMSLNLEKKLPNHKSQHILGCTLWYVLSSCAYGIATSEKGRFSSVQEPFSRSGTLLNSFWHLVRRACDILGLGRHTKTLQNRFSSPLTASGFYMRCRRTVSRFWGWWRLG